MMILFMKKLNQKIILALLLKLRNEQEYDYTNASTQKFIVGMQVQNYINCEVFLYPLF